MTTENTSSDNAVWGNVKLPPWWLILIEGILLIIIGIFFFVSPYQTLVTAVWVLGLYWLIRGIIDLISLIWDRSMWGWKIFAGVLGIIAGWILLQQPLAGSLVLSSALVFMLGFIGLFIGISSLIRGFKGAGWGTLILGVIEIILSIILLMNAGGAAAWMPWVLGMLAIFGGILTIIASFTVRSAEHALEDAQARAQAQAKQMKADQAAAVAAAAEAEALEAAEAVQEAPVSEDLKAIEGIGPKIAAALQAAGINSYADLAAASGDDLRNILKEAGLSADPETWSKQAAMAAAGDMDGLKAYQDKLAGGREA